MADQVLAGSLAWSYGELPSVLILLFIMSQWHREDARNAAREEAEAAVRGTPDLDAYNAYLDQLQQRTEDR